MKPSVITSFDFNSTMVRLKVDADSGEVLGEYIFQFHYGTIKSMFLVICRLKRTNFNSTMVRLKVLLSTK